MYVLYLDEAGTHGEARYFVLAGLAVFEREIYWFTKDLNDLQAEYLPQVAEPLNFRCSKLRTRAGDEVEPPWDTLSTEQRRDLKQRIYETIRNRRGVVFGCAIEKRYCEATGEEPYERAFEDLVSRFDLFMRRINREAVSEQKEEQRGLITVAQSSYEKVLRVLARQLSAGGTRWGELHTIADVPFFAPTADTRLLQYADFCANAIYGRYNSGLAFDFDLIAGKIDHEAGTVHGLAHLTTDHNCGCVACLSRRGRQLSSL